MALLPRQRTFSLFKANFLIKDIKYGTSFTNSQYRVVGSQVIIFFVAGSSSSQVTPHKSPFYAKGGSKPRSPFEKGRSKSRSPFEKGGFRGIFKTAPACLIVAESIPMQYQGYFFAFIVSKTTCLSFSMLLPPFSTKSAFFRCMIQLAFSGSNP